MNFTTLILCFIILLLSAIIMQKVDVKELVEEFKKLFNKIVNTSVKNADTENKEKTINAPGCDDKEAPRPC